MEGQCRLCLKQGKLENSHIIPSFLYRWLKETSGTGFLRFGRSPNRRVQDGYKDYWLCPNCEDLLSKWETEFAEKVFHPLVSGQASTFQYQDWLLKFGVSLSWRVLLYIKETADLSHFPERLRQETDKALARWAAFLLGQESHPAKYEQHMLPLDIIAGYTGGEMPPNINRYLLRSVDIDAVCSGSEAFVYVKLPHVLLVGFVHIKRPREWQGTKIHVRHGTLGAQNYVLPKEFGEYVMDQAQRLKELQESISEAQNKKIEESFGKVIDKLPLSGSFKAMHADVQLFGQDALLKKKGS